MRPVFNVILAALAFAGPAHAVNKCVVDGKIVYSERPCPTGTTSQSGAGPQVTAATASQPEGIKRGMTKAQVQAALGRPSSSRFGLHVPAPLCDSVGYAEEWTYASSHSASGGVVEFCRERVVYHTVVYHTTR